MEGFFIQYVKLKSVLRCQLHHEDNNNLELRGDMDLNDILIQIDELDFEEIFNVYDNTLTITFHKVNLPGIVTINRQSKKDEVKDDLNLIFPNQSTLTVTIRISKNKFNTLIKNKMLKDTIQSEPFKVITIFEQNTMFDLFSKTLLEIENDIVGTSWERFVIFLPFLDIPTSITPYSILIGRTSPSQIQIQRWFNFNKTIDDIKEQIDKRNINCNWNGGTKFLIPEMFWFEDSFMAQLKKSNC